MTSDQERIEQLKDQLLNSNLTQSEIATIQSKIEFFEQRAG